MTLLSVSELTVAFGDARAVDELSFNVEPGEAVGLVGESGSGKSQTALALMGLSPSNASVTGSVKLAGTEIVGAPESVIKPLRATRMAMVFQDPADALNPCVRVGDQLARILKSHGLADGSAARRMVLEALERVRLPDPERQYRAWPHELSGGMQQRAMIAAALIADPDLLIADEPTTALDVTVQARILDLLNEIRRDTALLLITHDLGVVANHCERMLVLEDGRLVEEGTIESVFAEPRHARTRALLAAARRRSNAPAIDHSETVLDVQGASVEYGRRDRVKAVKSANLVVKSGETVAIVGESGSGKTSIAAAITGLVTPRSGRVVFLGDSVAADVTDRPASVRKDLQLVFQNPAGSLNPQMRVEDIVAEPLRVHEPELSAAARREAVMAALESMDLDASFAGRFPHQLSGGQAQRVAIARALVLEPKLLICDEAVAALDGTIRERILDALQSIQQATGLAIVFISHDLSVVRSISHRVAVMYKGELVEVADTESIFEDPRHTYTKELLGSILPPVPAAAR